MRKSKVTAALISCFLVLCTILCVYTVLQSAAGKRVSILGHSVFYVLTGSMEPAIPTHAEIITRKTEPSKLKEGDIITFETTDTSMGSFTNTHRIVEVRYDKTTDHYSFLTKGDANPSTDDFIVPEEAVYGKVVWNSGPIDALLYFMKFITTGYGFFVVVILPLFAVVMILLRDFTREFRYQIQLEAEEREKRDLERAIELKEQMLAEEREKLQTSERGQTDHER